MNAGLAHQVGGNSSAVVWFRRDLRLADNPAWAWATNRYAEVTALFVLDPRILDAAGTFRRAQLFANLVELDRSLAGVGGRLRIRHGNPRRVVPEEVAATGAKAVGWNADVSPGSVARDDAVRAGIEPEVTVITHHGCLVLPPGSVLTAKGTVPRVFSAFHRRWCRTPWDPWPTPGAATISDDPGDGLPPVEVAPPRPAGEQAAHQALQRFAAGPVDAYSRTRDRIGESGTSELSVHLKFGTIAARHVIEAIGDTTSDRSAFVRQLAWRDWFAHLLAENPTLVDHAMRPEYDRIAWRDAPEDLERWKAGQTGYPIVDAAMRELTATGSMHNRLRMVAASFLVKDLLIDWRLGERHFREYLTDGDLPQNVGNWQWVAGTGPDAAPYFRIFNPVTQSTTHDPSGHYLRRWLPELSRLDDRTIHAPWQARPLDLAAAGVVLGVEYPEPMVDHRAAREQALEAYARARSSGR